MALAKRSIPQASYTRSVRVSPRCGELLKEMPKATPSGSNQYQRKEDVSEVTTHPDVPRTLSDLGIIRDQSSQWQQLADITKSGV